MPAGKSIKDRKSVADFVCDYMHSHHRALSIDTLLARPTDALRMALSVAAKAGRITHEKAKRLTRSIAAMEKTNADALEAADEICRAALSSRKRGDLKKDRY